MSRYRQLLATLEWHERRQQILERDKHACRNCGTEQNLNVHHRYYVAKRLPWDYPDWCLVTLCSNCHTNEHNKGVWDDWEWMVQDLQPDAPEAQELTDVIALKGFEGIKVDL